jgi:hypothetical protein
MPCYLGQWVQPGRGDRDEREDMVRRRYDLGGRTIERGEPGWRDRNRRSQT